MRVVGVLALGVVLAASLASAQPTARAGAPIVGELTSTDETDAQGRRRDEYVIQARAGQRLRVTLSSGAFDTLLVITGPANFSAENDDSGGALNSELAFEIPRDGEYRIGVTSYAAEGVGAYQLQIFDQITARPSRPTIIRAGQERTGTLADGDNLDDHTGGWADAYTLHGREGDRFTIRLTSTAFAPYLTVRGPDDFYAQGIGRDGEALIILEMPQDGDYRLSATAISPNIAGDYRLSVTQGVVAYEALVPEEYESRYSGLAADLSGQGRDEEAAIVMNAFLAQRGRYLPERWEDYISGQIILADYLMQAGHPEDAEQVIDNAAAAIRQIGRASPERLLVASGLASTARIIDNGRARSVVVRFASGTGRPDAAEIRQACVELTRASINIPDTQDADPYPSCEIDAEHNKDDAARGVLNMLSRTLTETILYTNRYDDAPLGELTVSQTRRVTDATIDTMIEISNSEGLATACAAILDQAWHIEWGDNRCAAFGIPAWLSGVDLAGMDDARAHAIADSQKDEIENSFDAAANHFAALPSAEARGLALILKAHLSTCGQSCASRREPIDRRLIRICYEMRDYACSLSQANAHLSAYGDENPLFASAYAAASARELNDADPRYEQGLQAAFDAYLSALEIAPNVEGAEYYFWNALDVQFLMDVNRPDLMARYADRGLAMRWNRDSVTRHSGLLIARADALRAQRRYREAVTAAREADALADPSQIWRESDVGTSASEAAQFRIARDAVSGDGDLTRDQAIDLGFQAAQRALVRNAGDTYAWTSLALTAEAQGARGAFDALRDAWVRQQANRREGAGRASAANLWIGTHVEPTALPLSEAARAQLERDLTRRVPNWRDLFTPPPVSIAQVREHLRPSEALVFLWTNTNDDDVWVAAISANDATFVKTQLSSGAVTAEITALRNGLCISACPAGAAPGFFDRARSHHLYEALFGDPSTRAILESSQQLIIVPGGPFTSLPFNTLVSAPPEGLNDDPDALRHTSWLGLEKAIEVVPSVHLVIQSRAQRRNAAAGRGGYLGIAPTFGTGANAEGPAMRTLVALPELVGAQEEVRAQGERLGADASVLLVGRDANEAALKRTLDSARFGTITFATHAFISNELGDVTFEPALALAPAGVASTEDGLLTASEITRLRVNGAWVILSACNTAAGGRAGGNGLSGLTRAFLLAGAQTVMVTHWAVRDDAASRLSIATIEFQRANPHISAAEALRRAMRMLIDDVSGDDDELTLADPAVWAPFMIVGASRD